jgi:deferrochelatase/peroxidase EfeB
MCLPQAALDEIQGFITSGYGHLRYSAYLFVHIENPVSARQWLQRVTPLMTTSRPWPVDNNGKPVKPSTAINLALTAEGLVACGLPRAALRTFAPEFVEGMASGQRARILGDSGASAAAHWEIGGPNNEALHAVVIVHAQDAATLEATYKGQRALFTDAGLREVANGLQLGCRPQSECEPFGFRDGIAQPAMRGLDDEGSTGVPPGEFVLGYENHYGLIAPTPVVPANLDPQDMLPRLANPYHAGLDLRDFGCNGSYIVYRKLRQDVAGFWRFMRHEAMRISGNADTARMIWLAAKCLGRWPSGAPLALAPHVDDPQLASRDDFLYGNDAKGYGCPLGAHVRRTNPRDMLKPYPAKQSLSMTEAHRILRRGRVFGEPLFDLHILQRKRTPEEEHALLNIADDGQPRGIHFIGINASIKSQFEFIQQGWCNNPRFGGLNENLDPVIAGTAAGGIASRMTIPGKPAGIRTAPLQHFVSVSGGAYLFLPAVSALRFLAALKV